MIQKPRWTPDISVGSVCIVVTVALTIGGGLFGACWELSGQLSGHQRPAGPQRPIHRRTKRCSDRYAQ